MTHTKTTAVDRFDLSRRDTLARIGLGIATAGLVPAGLAQAAPPRIASTAGIEGKGKGHSLAPALVAARNSRASLDGLNDYTATFYGNELVGRKRVTKKLLLKVREKPFSVYIKFALPHKGREVIYVDGQNGGNLLAHVEGIASLAGTLKLDPRGSQAMEESRYPVTMIGMRYMIDTIINQWESELSSAGGTVRKFQGKKVGDSNCTVFQSLHPKKKAGLKFHLTRLFIDEKTSFPIRVEQFDFPTGKGGSPQLAEQYTYLNVKQNVGLKNIDFSTKNKTYGF